MRARLVRESQLGDNEAPEPRPLPEPDAVLRWGRPLLLPLSSAMRVDTPDRVVALTYDDGPNPAQTPGVLDALARHDARATFFVLTDRAERHPDLVREMLARGHEVGLHGIDHARLTSLPGREAASRVREGKRRLEAVTGRPVRLYRPTYGAQGLLQYLATRRLGMDVVIWTAWARDWADGPAAEVADRAVGALHPGAVVLLHDTTDDTREEDLPRPTFSREEVTELILEGAEQKGFGVLPAGELLARYPAVRAVTTQRTGLRRRPGPPPG
jgi:peptidoglycan/xylan/chitin deacetylase (PgdA/CDA1 family)